MNISLEVDVDDMSGLARAFNKHPEAFGNLLVEMAGEAINDPHWQTQVAAVASCQPDCLIPALRSIAYRTDRARK